MTKNFVFMVAELRRYPQMSYKSDITVLSGLDAGDRKALDQRFRSDEYPNCQIDKEDKRFVLKGPAFNMMEVINTLVQERGYQIEYNPQQHGIPLKAGNVDDKFCILYHLSKPLHKPTSTSSTIAHDGKLSKADEPDSRAKRLLAHELDSAIQDLDCQEEPQEPQQEMQE